MDHQPRPRLRKKKRRRDRLIRLTELNEDWVSGFEDEVWWSRLAALPSLHSFSEKGKPLRLEQRSVAKDDPDPKAVSCYGLYLPEFEETWWLRFVDGRPVSAITTQFLRWCCQKLENLLRNSDAAIRQSETHLFFRLLPLLPLHYQLNPPSSL